jgi:catecholate siderophore receptor
MAVITPVMSVQAAEADQQLRTVVVKDTKEKDPLNLNENNGYQATKTRIGKTAQDPHDIPQGVTVLTRELLNDQQASSLKDALRNVSGLTFNAAEGGRAGDNIMLRGFTTYGDTYLDGVRDSASCRTRDGRSACCFFLLDRKHGA